MAMHRRRFIHAIAAGIAATTLPAAAAVPTPRQSAGPFYPDELPLDRDNDLVQVEGRSERAQGEVSDLRGRLLDRNGQAIENARIEIWQCDANGRYRHSRDPGRAPIDPGFQGFGQALSDERGRYRFRTIRPVPYPGRAPHIHVAVYLPGDRPFVTQLYVAGDPRNNDDFLYRRLSAEQRGLVTAAFEPNADGGEGLAARWDVILGVG